jgi:hypothetical protein
VTSFLSFCQAPATATLLKASGSEFSPKPIPAGVAASSERMSGKASGKKPRDAAEDALLQLQALRHSHREATRLFLMAVREGATDAQITDALRQVLPAAQKKRSQAPRVKLRRRNQRCCSPQTALLQLWKPFLPTTGAGLGRLAGRSC